MSKILASIIIGTNRPANILETAKNISETSSDPSGIELLFSVDKGDEKTIEAVETVKKDFKMQVKYLEGVRSRGYFSANNEYNRLLEMVDENAYYIANFSDKTRLKSKNWDDVLRKYIHHFEDDVFRIKISSTKNYKYEDRRECYPKCETFAFLTKRYMSLIGGWGNNWGPDSWLQIIEYDLDKEGYKRGIAVDDIELETYIYTTGPNEKAHRLRSRMIEYAYHFFTGHPIANIFARYHVTKIKMYIENYEKIKDGYSFEYKDHNTTILLYDSAKHFIKKHSVQPRLEFRRPNKISIYYKLSSWNQLAKLYTKKFQLNKLDMPFQYYFFKIPGFITSPFLRISEVLRNFTANYIMLPVIRLIQSLAITRKYYSQNFGLESLIYRKYSNGLEFIDNKYIDDVLQKQYLLELEELKEMD